MNRKHACLVACLLGFCIATSAVAPESPELPNITKPDFSKVTARRMAGIIDGDPIVVSAPEGFTKVRLIGVDTSETVPPSKPVERYGKEASRFTRNLLQGEKVYFVTDPQQGEKDGYGRMLAYVYRAPHGLFVNAEIIRQGYGHAFVKFPFKYIAQFRQLERFTRTTWS